METGGKRIKNEEIISTIKTLKTIGGYDSIINDELMPRIDKYSLPIELLFSYNVDLSNLNVKKLLMEAISKDYEEIAKILLAYPLIDINKGDTTFLMHAVKQSKYVQLLLSHPSIDVNVQNSDGWTALMIATMDDNQESVQLLLSHPGIHVNLTNNRKQTSLIISTFHGRNNSIQLLLSHPSISVNATDDYESSALYYALKKRNESAIIAIARHPDTHLIVYDTHHLTNKCIVLYYGIFRSQRIGNLPKHICKLINTRILLNSQKTDVFTLSKMMGFPDMPPSKQALRRDLSDILSAGHYYYNETTYQIQRARRLGIIQRILRPMLSSLTHGLSDIAGIIDPTTKTLEEIKKLLE
jgi:Ankyrin repeats (3 copies)